MGQLKAICISARKGEPKRSVRSAILRAHHGIEGDAHAGSGHRQVSLLRAESADEVRQTSLPDLQPGDFAENLLIAELNLDELGLGSTLRVGPDAVLSVTQIGKACHTPCHIQTRTGHCLMRTGGIFARVLERGAIQVGDPVNVIRGVSRALFQAAVLTVSDRCSRGEATDTAGPAVARLLETELGAHIYERAVLPDEKERLSDRLRYYADDTGLDLIVAVGGTGFAPRDVTPEAVAAVIERPTPGLDEAMRAASLRHTPHAMLSRARSGIRGGTLILSLPGSERGALENLQAVLPALGHGLSKLRGDPSDCGRVRVMAGQT